MTSMARRFSRAVRRTLFCRAPPLLALAGGSFGTRRKSRGHTPPPRSLKTSRKEQEFDPAPASGEHTTGNKRALRAQC